MDDSNVRAGKQLLIELHRLMKVHKENNWIKGVEAALAALDKGSFGEAQAIYRTMTEGGRGLSD